MSLLYIASIVCPRGIFQYASQGMSLYKAYASRGMLKYASQTGNTIFITQTKDKTSIYLSLMNFAQNIANFAKNIANFAQNIAGLLLFTLALLCHVTEQGMGYLQMLASDWSRAKKTYHTYVLLRKCIPLVHGICFPFFILTEKQNRLYGSCVIMVSMSRHHQG